MCLVHLFDSWYSLSLALPHSKYFLHGRARIPRSTRRPSPSRRLPGLMCHADMTGHELSAQETTPEGGKRLLCAANHHYSCLWNAGAFHEVSTSYFNTGKISDSDNSQCLTCFCSSSWGYVCDLANSQHGQWISSEDAPGKHTTGQQWWTCAHLGFREQHKLTNKGVLRPKHSHVKAESTFLNKEGEPLHQRCWKKLRMWSEDYLIPPLLAEVRLKIS